MEIVGINYSIDALAGEMGVIKNSFNGQTMEISYLKDVI